MKRISILFALILWISILIIDIVYIVQGKDVPAIAKLCSDVMVTHYVILITKYTFLKKG